MNWINPYIDKIDAIPDLLLSIDGNQATQQEREIVLGKASGYQQIFCEAGSGSGKHLITLARNNPDSFYVGIEKRYKRAFRTAEKAQQQNLQNLFVLRAELSVLESIFGEASLAGVYMNFPDPWEKRRWNKHRMLSPEFAGILCRLLKPGGSFCYKSDHIEAFNDAREILENTPSLTLTELTLDLAESEYEQSNIETEFESLFRSKGLKINFLRAKRN